MIFKSTSTNSAFKVIPVEEQVFIFVGAEMSGKSHFGRSITNAVIVDDIVISTTEMSNQTYTPTRKFINDIRKRIVEFKLGTILKFSKAGVRERTNPDNFILIFVCRDFERVHILHSIIAEVLQDIYDGYITKYTKGLPE